MGKNLPANAGFDPWSRKIPRTTEQVSPCAAATEAHALQSLWSAAEAPMRSLHTITRVLGYQTLVAPAHLSSRKPAHGSERPSAAERKCIKRYNNVHPGAACRRRNSVSPSDVERGEMQAELRNEKRGWLGKTTLRSSHCAGRERDMDP